MARSLPHSIVESSKVEYVRLTMANYKEKAIGILLVLGSILVLMATWDLPENQPPQLQ